MFSIQYTTVSQCPANKSILCSKMVKPAMLTLSSQWFNPFVYAGSSAQKLFIALIRGLIIGRKPPGAPNLRAPAVLKMVDQDQIPLEVFQAFPSLDKAIKTA